MNKLYYKTILFIKIFIYVNVLSSCTSPLELIKNKNFDFKENIVPVEKNVIFYLDKYINSYGFENKGFYTVFSKENLYSKNVKSFYITREFNMSSVFDQPCTGYFIYKNHLVLVYSKKLGFINPVNYSKKFIKIITQNSYDDWTLKRISCTEEQYLLDTPIVSNDSPAYFINGNLQKELSYYEFNFNKICYGEKYFSYTNFVDLDNFRTIYLEDCKD